MNRRHVLALGAVALAGANLSAVAGESGHITYDRAAYEKLLASGKPVMLDFYASW